MDRIRRGGGGALKGRYIIMPPRKLLRTRRGGGRVVRGGDACVAVAGGTLSPTEIVFEKQTEEKASMKAARGASSLRDDDGCRPILPQETPFPGSLTPQKG